MSENIYYVYVYLNPLKPGGYTFCENCIGIDFLCAPFYIGKGWGSRQLMHIKEAKKYELLLQEKGIKEDKSFNRHKVNTINKIYKNGQEPIVYKIFENLDQQTALILERYLICIIGRKDNKKGPLTNLTDGGDGVIGVSEDTLKLSVKNRKQTYDNNPEIQIKAIIKLKETLSNNPGMALTRVMKGQETLRKNPHIRKNMIEKYKKTYEDNPEIRIESIKKMLQTRKDNPNIEENANIKRKETWGHKSKEDMNVIISKIAQTKKDKRVVFNTNVKRYCKLKYDVLIKLYFNTGSVAETLKRYKEITTYEISTYVYSNFLRILNFPTNTTIMPVYPKMNEIYAGFKKENENNILHFIEGYEQKVREYFNINNKK